jgi:L-alanine-DL-glutamate epimerase-like enolase superfamily enzyme
VSPIDDVSAAAYTVPTPEPESDGTLEWDSTTAVVVTVSAGGETGIGWSYGPAAATSIITGLYADLLHGRDALAIPGCYTAMRVASRNAMLPGLVTIALSAVDVALWDLKSRLLGVALPDLFGVASRAVRVYGSGGFTSMPDGSLAAQIDGWLGDGITAVKMKIGRDETRDLHRISLVRKEIGDAVALMVDANGAYRTKQAVRMSRAFEAEGVSWFEEPVSSDHLADLALLRGILTPEVAAGEYGTGPEYFRRMCGAGAVDCLQIDATRAGGYSGFLASAAVADAFGLEVSAHCAPTLHRPVCAATPNLRHVEWFADHVRVEHLLFEGAAGVRDGAMHVEDTVPIALHAGAERYRTV